MKCTMMILAFFVTAVLGCGPNQRILNSAENSPRPPASEPTNSAPTVRTFETDLAAMRTADFNFIYVFRRKDGAVLEADDKSFIGQNTPTEMNRRSLSDGGKAVMIGSNFRLAPDIVNLFKERFLFEDYSKPESEIMNANANR